MKKMQRKGQGVCVMLLILFSFSACNSVKWDWKANPFSADHISQAVYNGRDEIVKCEEERFSEFTCFDYADMESLIFNIKRLQRQINKSRISRKAKRNFNFHTNNILKELPKHDTAN